MPLTDIYNAINLTCQWLSVWKIEYVTVIPKKSVPGGFADLRNISCTPLASKIYETFVRDWAMQQVKLKSNQYGGVAGCGTQHMLIDMWQKILSDLEDPRAATAVAAIDYAKAFNRMSFDKCLESFANEGATRSLMQILGAFLEGRRMTVRVGESWSDMREVMGGFPQGSVLGVLLFNCTIDDLEDQSNYVSRPVRLESESDVETEGDEDSMEAWSEEEQRPDS